MRDKRTVVIGTRGSPLALAQARQVAAQLHRMNPGREFSVRTIATGGDRVTNWAQVRDETGIFVREIQAALRAGDIDLAVHSVKDMPSVDAPGLELACVPGREDPRDVLIAKGGVRIDELPPGAVIGTSSVRRTAQLLRRRGDLRVVELRGNVETRIRKMNEGAIDATVLAAAGIIRLGLEALITEYLPTEWMLPAPCQGALGIEIREDDAEARAMTGDINDPSAFACVSAERSFMRRLGAGCRVPVSALAELREGTLQMRGGILDAAARCAVEGDDRGPAAESRLLGIRLAESLLTAGGAEILESVRGR